MWRCHFIAAQLRRSPFVSEHNLFTMNNQPARVSIHLRMQALYCLSCRFRETCLQRAAFTQNRAFWVGVGLVAAMQALVTYTPGVQVRQTVTS